MDGSGVFIRKLAITFVSAFAGVFLLSALDMVDAFELQDWSTLSALGWSAFIAGIASGARALIALLFAFVPTDAADGVNIAGKFSGDGPTD